MTSLSVCRHFVVMHQRKAASNESDFGDCRGAFVWGRVDVLPRYVLGCSHFFKPYVYVMLCNVDRHCQCVTFCHCISQRKQCHTVSLCRVQSFS